MLKLLQYYGAYHSFRGTLGSLPTWARWLLFLVALPGIAAILLSILALGVSILALLLLTVPAYRLLVWLTGGNRGGPTLPLEADGITVDNAYTVASGVEEWEDDEAGLPQLPERPDEAHGPGGARGSPGEAAPPAAVDGEVMDSPPARPGRRQIDVKIIE